MQKDDFNPLEITFKEIKRLKKDHDRMRVFLEELYEFLTQHKKSSRVMNLVPTLADILGKEL